MTEIEKLKAENERLRAWIEHDATCPCCERTDVCSVDCTFDADCPAAAEHMRAARNVLDGGVA